MNRRTQLKRMLAACAGVVFGWTRARAQTGAPGRPATQNPIYLFVEMEVVPEREREMLDNFHNIFVPEARKHDGFISVRMLKLREVVLGPPQAINYRFELVYESEELRQIWIASPGHQEVWPTVERTLRNQTTYPVLLFDEV